MFQRNLLALATAALALGLVLPGAALAQSPAAPAKEIKIAHIYSKTDRKSTRLNSSHVLRSRMPSSA